MIWTGGKTDRQRVAISKRTAQDTSKRDWMVGWRTATCRRTFLFFFDSRHSGKFIIMCCSGTWRFQTSSIESFHFSNNCCAIVGSSSVPAPPPTSFAPFMSPSTDTHGRGILLVIIFCLTFRAVWLMAKWRFWYWTWLHSIIKENETIIGLPLPKRSWTMF